MQGWLFACELAVAVYQASLCHSFLNASGFCPLGHHSAIGASWGEISVRPYILQGDMLIINLEKPREMT